MLYSFIIGGILILTKHKHLTLDDRCKIFTMLSSGESFSQIGKELEKDPTTISKEIRSHLSFEKTVAPGRIYNSCLNRRKCHKEYLCMKCKYKRQPVSCSLCKLCNSFCKDFVKEECPKLSKPPYVCNGCDSYQKCTLEKCLYNPKTANNEYKEMLSESRKGISLNEEELEQLDNFVSPLLQQGQSIHNICINNSDTIMLSKNTIYRIVDYGLLKARNINLPRKVRFAKRKNKRNFKVDKKCRIGRTYNDFKQYISENPDTLVTEMDSVEGSKGGKVLLTIHFKKAELMLAFIRDHNDSKSVTDIFNSLYEILGHDNFSKAMPLLLGDNGSEFSNPTALEVSSNGQLRTKVFYCEPNSPGQKGSAERNHEFIRMFIPKGKPMDQYTQEEISLMMNHINSYSRPSLNNKTPYDTFKFFYGQEILDLLSIEKIPANKVTLNNTIWNK